MLTKNRYSTTGITALVVNEEVEVEYHVDDDGMMNISAVWMGVEDVTTPFLKYHHDEITEAAWRDYHEAGPM